MTPGNTQAGLGGLVGAPRHVGKSAGSRRVRGQLSAPSRRHRGASRAQAFLLLGTPHHAGAVSLGPTQGALAARTPVGRAPWGVPESRRRAHSRRGGGRTWGAARGDVRPRRAPVPARSAQSSGNKASCAFLRADSPPARSAAAAALPKIGRERGRAERCAAGSAGRERGAGTPPRISQNRQERGQRPGGGDARGSGGGGGHRVRLGGGAAAPRALPVSEPQFPRLPNGDACAGHGRKRSGMSWLNEFLHQPDEKRVGSAPFYK